MKFLNDINFSLKREIEDRANVLDERHFVFLCNDNYNIIKKLVFNVAEFDNLYRNKLPLWINIFNKDDHNPLTSTEILSGQQCAIVFDEEYLLEVAVTDYLSLILFNSPYSSHFFRVAGDWYYLAKKNGKSKKAIWYDFYMLTSKKLNEVIVRIDSLSEEEWNKCTEVSY